MREDMPNDQSENKKSSTNIGPVLAGNKNRETMNQEELDEAEIKDCLYKAFMVAFTHESSHHLLFNEDLLFCLEYCREISIDVKKKLAKFISTSILIQERLLKKEIISGIAHLLEHKDEKDMLKHTILA